MEQDQTNSRKSEHLRIIHADAEVDRQRGYFDAIHLTHRALPECALDEVDTTVRFLGKSLSFPLLISSMTGGDGEELLRINRNLAVAAEQTGVAMAVGSQRVMFTHPGARASFDLRTYAPRTTLLSNFGATQLNQGFGASEARAAIEVLGADGLYVHLNALQEAVQPEGNTNFKGLARKIGQLAQDVSVPVLVKEVGAGWSLPDARLLLDEGIQYLDVAGSGGTSWSRIEAQRGDQNLGMLFQDWGIPTPLALEQLAPLTPYIHLIASGGLRHGLDMVKSMVLGAELCGLAKPFLAPAMDSAEAVVALIERLRREFQTAMFLLGAKRIRDVVGHTEFLLPASRLS